MLGLKWVRYGITVLALVGASASSVWAMSAAEKQVAQKASRLFSGQELEVTQLSKSDLFEILVLKDKSIYYVDKDVQFLFDGQLHDINRQVNLTRARTEELMRIKLSDLTMKDAVRAVNGKGSRQLIVFEDPNCGFCRQLRTTLATIPDLTVHYFLVAFLGEDSRTKTQNILCSADPAKVLHAWMEKKVTPAAVNGNRACAERLARNQAFAKKHAITGTPTLFFSDGSRLIGAQPDYVIQQKLANLE